jgi:hypothetical protein
MRTGRERPSSWVPMYVSRVCIEGAGRGTYHLREKQLVVVMEDGLSKSHASGATLTLVALSIQQSQPTFTARPNNFCALRLRFPKSSHTTSRRFRTLTITTTTKVNNHHATTHLPSSPAMYTLPTSARLTHRQHKVKSDSGHQDSRWKTKILAHQETRQRSSMR